MILNPIWTDYKHAIILELYDTKSYYQLIVIAKCEKLGKKINKLVNISTFKLFPQTQLKRLFRKAYNQSKNKQSLTGYSQLSQSGHHCKADTSLKAKADMVCWSATESSFSSLI